MAKVLKSNIPYKGPETENLITLIRNGLRKNCDETIFIDSKSGRPWKGSELEANISFVARALIKAGLKKGDVCSLYGEESDHIVIILLAIITAGGAPNYLTNKSSGREIHDTASVLESKFLISTKELVLKLKPDVKDLENQLKLLPYSIVEESGSLSIRFDFTTDDISQSPDETLPGVENRIKADRDYAIIQFSSGTTGKPKPIPRTHKNLCHLVASVDHKELMDLKPGVVITGSLPITHRPGLWALLASIHCGSTFVIWSNLSDVEDALKTIMKYRVTIFSSSLPFLSMLGNLGIKMKDKYDTSSWEHIITSGAKIVNPDLPKSLIEEFKLKSLRQCFGMTESGWVFLIEQSLAAGNYLSVGHVCPGMEAVVLNRETLEKVEAYERGEIALKGPQIFPGYLTNEPGVLNRSDFTENGDWFRIGDQGYYDKNDLVFIEGRYKEVMMFENNCLYFPNEIEAIIAEHPAIEGACVVKAAEVRKDYPYDIAMACITLKHGFNLKEQELIEFIHERTPQVILGGGVKILDRFPRLQNGKVDKFALAKLS